jgi:hypothetical protein
MTWKQLKDFCNNLPESELEKNVILWRECDVIIDISAEQLDQDHYVNESGDDGCFPLFEAESQIKFQPDEFPKGLDGFVKVYDKGHPILNENF